jgi:hypothetical protein
VSKHIFRFLVHNVLRCVQYIFNKIIVHNRFNLFMTFALNLLHIGEDSCLYKYLVKSGVYEKFKINSTSEKIEPYCVVKSHSLKQIGT